MANKDFAGGWRKRPKDATPQEAKRLRDTGLTYAQIGKLWDISAQQVFNLVKKANARS